MKISISIASAVCAILLSGCAKSSSDVTGAYVSPVLYQDWTCKQLAEEAQRISMKVIELSGAQDKKRTNDTIATTAAIVVFWPAAFLVGGDDHQTAELSRLKGQMEAVEQTAIRKNCGIEFRRG